MNQKIDTKGVYLPFEGYTVISFLKDRNNHKIESLFELIKELSVFNKYYRMLPISSFHMTIKNFISVADKNFDMTKRIGSIPDALFHTTPIEKFSQVCRIMGKEIECELGSMYTDRSLGVCLKPMDMPYIKQLRSVLVALGMTDEPDFVFHMTFAYKFAHITSEDKETLKEEFKLIYEMLKSTFEPCFKLSFEPARFCYFPSMQEYIPL